MTKVMPHSKKVSKVNELQVEKALGAKTRECFQMIAQGNIMKARAILDFLGLNVGRDSKHNTLLHISATNADIEACKMLIELGFSIFAPNSAGVTPIEIACESADSALKEFFLKEKYTALLLNTITSRGSLSEFADAIQNGAEVGRLFKMKPFLGAYPLHYIAYYDMVDFAIYLLENSDTDINATNLPMSETALHVASQYNYSHMIKALVKYGACIEQGDANGWHPIHRAVISNSMHALSTLIQSNAKVNAQDSLGETSLHLAIKYKNYAMIPILLHANASVAIRNKNAETSINLARCAGIKITRYH